MKKYLANCYKFLFKYIDVINYKFLYPFILKTRFLLPFYYCFFSNSFKREFYGVLAGKQNFYKNLLKIKRNSYFLIRSTHGIEKGLLMKERKEIFALDYIYNTVEVFKNLYEDKEYLKTNFNQLKWSYDILDEYFKIVKTHPIIEKSRVLFKSINDASNLFLDFKNIPFEQNSITKSNINYQDFLKLIKQRKSTRWFISKKVPRELIDKAIAAASLAPSACNRQPFEFRIYDDPVKASILGKIPIGTKGFGGSLPVVAILIGKLDAFFSERDRHLIYIDGGLTAMNFMLALETLGISSCPINWPDISKQEKVLKKILGLSNFERPIMVIGLGYADPDTKVAYSVRKSIEVLRSYNKVN